MVSMTWRYQGQLPGLRQSPEPSLTVGLLNRFERLKSVARASTRALPRANDLWDFDGALQASCRQLFTRIQQKARIADPRLTLRALKTAEPKRLYAARVIEFGMTDGAVGRSMSSLHTSS